METLTTMFGNLIKPVMALSKTSTHITEDNVYQEGVLAILPYLDGMVEKLILPGSGIDGFQNLEDLLAKAESGKSCLLLPEHYSNLDLSLISYLARKEGGRGDDIAKSIVAIAGMKLNEENPVVAAFAGAYTRIVIYPTRSLSGLPDEKKQAELLRSAAINRAAVKALANAKAGGRLVLVFPAGTRYRPWDQSSKRGVREVDSYIKSFDYMCFIALNGEVLHVREGNMMDDAVSRDVVRLTVSPVISCAEFREKARNTDEADKKQAVVDAIMQKLQTMHLEGEERRKLLH